MSNSNALNSHKIGLNSLSFIIKPFMETVKINAKKLLIYRQIY